MNQDPQCPTCHLTHPVGANCPKKTGLVGRLRALPKKIGSSSASKPQPAGKINEGRGASSDKTGYLIASQAAERGAQWSGQGARRNQGEKEEREKERDEGPSNARSVIPGQAASRAAEWGGQAPRRDWGEKELHSGKLAHSESKPISRYLHPGLEDFLGEVLANTRRQRRRLTRQEVEALMRHDEQYATAEDNFDRADYIVRLQRFSIEDKDDSYFQALFDVTLLSKITFRVYINARPSQAAEIFSHLNARKLEIVGLIDVKIWGSGSWKGRRDLIVAYFVDARTAYHAARGLAIDLALAGGWPDSWVRRDVLPGTFRVGPGLGVAWDPQHLFEGGQHDSERLKVYFGTTHTERYSTLIYTFLERHAVGSSLQDIARTFAGWVSEHVDPLRPYNPPAAILNNEYSSEQVLDPDWLEAQPESARDKHRRDDHQAH